jgi:hypothetical protein
MYIVDLSRGKKITQPLLVCRLETERNTPLFFRADTPTGRCAALLPVEEEKSWMKISFTLYSLKRVM